MIPVLVSGPAAEPLTLAEAKIWLKIDHSEEDDLIRALIIAARLTVEAEIGQVLIAQNWRLIGDVWPGGERTLVRVGPILSVLGGRVFDNAGNATMIAASTFSFVPNARPSELIATQKPSPGRVRAGIEIDLRLGFGELAAQVPEPLRQAIRLLIGRWFEHRGDSGGDEEALPATIKTLVAPYRRIRL
jgi:uncharacterized phiE125 gp8 family phage protein